MMTHILTISIGPVQDFIAAARKTRDLKNGSELLSGVAGAIAECVSEAGAKLIFPADVSAGAPNKIVCECNGDPRALAETAHEAAKVFLRSEADKALDHLRQKQLERHVDRERLRQQLGDFLEFYAAWAEVQGPDGYSEARTRADRTLAARKALRGFTQPGWSQEGVPKSALDGGRDTVVLKGVTDEELLRIGAKVGEQLDGVSLVKRVRDEGFARFPSVVRVAADPFYQALGPDRREPLASMLSEHTDGDLVQELQGAARGLYCDFPWDIDAQVWADPTPASLGAQIRAIVGAKTPPAYYAILAADGDKMGEALGRLDSPDAHRAVSEALGRFAKRATGIVRDCRGALVYAGGDDVLALAPVPQALRCADSLRRAFADELQQATDSPPTLSVGVAVVHIHENLRSALQYARNAENRAKTEGRNALAVARHTRGAGPDVATVVMSWDEDPVQGVWERAMGWFREGELPSGVAYELRELARVVTGPPGSTRLPEDDSRAIATCEVERILGRKRDAEGMPIGQEVIGALTARLTKLAESEGYGRALQSLAQTLVIAHSLSTIGKGASHD